MAEPEPLGGRLGDDREADAGDRRVDIATWYATMDEVDVDASKLQIEEGMVAEVMKRLEEEINRPSAGGYGVGDVPWFYFLSSASSFPSSPSVVAVGGNEESCGPSFSDSSSTVMASIDTRGVVCRPALAAVSANETGEIWPWFPGPGAALGDPAEGTAVDGGATPEGTEGGDDEWLKRVLGEIALEPEPLR